MTTIYSARFLSSLTNTSGYMRFDVSGTAYKVASIRCSRGIWNVLGYYLKHSQPGYKYDNFSGGIVLFNNNLNLIGGRGDETWTKSNFTCNKLLRSFNARGGLILSDDSSLNLNTVHSSTFIPISNGRWQLHGSFYNNTKMYLNDYDNDYFVLKPIAGQEPLRIRREFLEIA